ncbi:MAG: hypothetical protein U5L11_15890 [Arhodomonas sp.]|nr:hypothetical protein [Arhodomonas sp.]
MEPARFTIRQTQQLITGQAASVLTGGSREAERTWYPGHQRSCSLHALLRFRSL